MKKRTRRGPWLAAAAFSAVLAGAGLAQSSSQSPNCPYMDTNDCVTMDQTMEDNCCINTDSSVYRTATCTRELFFCDSPLGFTPLYNGPYNCHDPGDPCR